VNISLQDMMNRMARGDLSPSFVSSHLKASPPKILNEIEGFSCFDSLLKTLSKQYEDARGQRKALIKSNGLEDAMTQMAIDNEDSYWCAMQTRYLELREDSILMRRVQKMIYDSQCATEQYAQDLIARKKEQKANYIATRLRLYMIFLKQLKQQNKPSYIFEMFAAFLFLNLSLTGISKPKHNVMQAVSA